MIMADIEALKPSNTGWLVADVVPDTFAFGWARTEVDPALLALLADEQWQPYLVFPEAFVPGGRVVTEVQPATSHSKSKRPLFVLLDATWPEARKMFRKSPYLDKLPVLHVQSEQLSSYKLRRSQQDSHFCTSEVAALCLALGGEALAAQTLASYLNVFTSHYLRAKQQLPVDWASAAHQHLNSLQANGHVREQLLNQE
jgi:DTW domain-containing protein YfiP